MVSKLALGAIWGYQRYVSPRKGFRCAHSVLHGGTGCSGFAKYAIRDHGFWGAVPHIRQRFRDCKSASETLRDRCAVHSRRADGEDEETEEKRKRRRDRDGPCSCWNDLCNGLPRHEPLRRDERHEPAERPRKRRRRGGWRFLPLRRCLDARLHTRLRRLRLRAFLQLTP
jgi:putative component of membrane protein insertase Oxa1/YidC/SpoIIIJ protein YidD